MLLAALALAALLTPGVALAGQIAVTSVAGWPGTIEAGDAPANAIDGNIDTYATLHGARDGGDSLHFAIGFERASVNRIRLWKQSRATRSRNLAVEYTTGSGPLAQRSWKNVSHLATGFNGEFIHSTTVNADGTIEDDDHDSPPVPDGAGHLWASVTFDTVVATGLRLTFADGRAAPGECEAPGTSEVCNVLRIAEFQAHYETPPDLTPPLTVATLSLQPNSAGWINANVTVNVHAIDDAGGSGVHHVTYSSSGAQVTSPIIVAGADASLSVTVEGITTIAFFATDGAGNEERMQALTVKLDKTDPTVTGLPARCVLAPADGKLATVAKVSASDRLSGPGSFTVSATSNQKPGAGTHDIVLSGAPPRPTTVRLRADSREAGAGRVYTLTVVANDIAGNTTVAMTTCTVARQIDD